MMVEILRFNGVFFLSIFCNFPNKLLSNGDVFFYLGNRVIHLKKLYVDFPILDLIKVIKYFHTYFVPKARVKYHFNVDTTSDKYIKLNQ